MGKDYERAIRLDRVLLDQIGGHWMLLVLGALCDHEGAARFNVIKRSVPDDARLHIDGSAAAIDPFADQIAPPASRIARRRK